MPQEPEDTLDGAEPAAQFTAMVIEVRDSGTQAILLVEPMDGDCQPFHCSTARGVGVRRKEKIFCTSVSAWRRRGDLRSSQWF